MSGKVTTFIKGIASNARNEHTEIQLLPILNMPTYNLGGRYRYRLDIDIDISISFGMTFTGSTLS